MILDCTLRDGGYINQWNFGNENIPKIIKDIERSGIEIIECGFIEDKDYDAETSVYPNEKKMSLAFTKKQDTMYVGMIALGDIDPLKISKRTKNGIDGIRLTFHKDDSDEEFRQAKILMEKGYEVFIQPVGTTTYSDYELIELISRVNKLHPFAFYIVDTLGVMYPEDVHRIYSIINHNLDSNIKIGFHSHNNLQLSFANAQLFISEGIKREGGVIIDSSIYGMGRGAGNLSTELITQYINQTYGHKYDPLPLLNVADVYLSQIYMKTPWGYSIPYYLSAVNNCHPNYSNYLMTKKSLNVSDIAKILNLIPDNSKELYNKKLIESLYLEYQSSDIDDSDTIVKLKEAFGNDKTILVIASGNSIKENTEIINKWIKEHDCIIVHINTIKEYIPADYLFLSNSKKSESTSNIDPSVKTILTSNITKSDIKADYRVNYSSLLGNNSELDNAGLMFISLLIRLGVKKVELAGFDGFKYDSKDYLEFVSGSYMQKDLDYRNEKISVELWRFSQYIDIDYLTPTMYNMDVKNE
jgi:4-hydroxy 2-oxovalerate aldolase